MINLACESDIRGLHEGLASLFCPGPAKPQRFSHCGIAFNAVPS